MCNQRPKQKSEMGRLKSLYPFKNKQVMNSKSQKVLKWIVSAQKMLFI
jgi:hypothetical protein